MTANRENHTENRQPKQIDRPEDLLLQNPLIKLLDDSPRVRILAVLLGAKRPLNPTDIVERAHIGTRTWYNHKDALQEAGLVEKVGNAGNSPLFAVPDSDNDQRVEWFEKIHDWTGAYLRDGERPRDDA